MAQPKRKALIPVLMTVSICLLSLFLAQWLYNEYTGEKERLHKDLSQAMADVQAELTESSIFKQIILPALKEEDLPWKMDISLDSMLTSAGNTRIIKRKIIHPAGDTHDTTIIEVLQNSSSEANINLEDPAVIAERVSQFSMDNPALKDITRGLKVLIRELSGDTLQTVAYDSTLLKINYDKALQQRGYDFRSDWSGENDKGIRIVASMAAKDYSLSVRGYGAYLLQQMLPELLFAVLLLSITGAAFTVMYRGYRAQERLSMMKNELVSNMTHELKTPIATVKVALEALNSFGVLNDPARSREYLQMAVSEMDRLELLVNQALNTSMLESGTLQIKHEQHNIPEIVRQAVSVLQPRIKQKGAVVHIRVADEQISSLVDRLHFQGVLINILDNGLKYADKTPELSIAVSELNGIIRISISDNGPGIPPRYLDRIFDKFFRVPSGNVHNVKGHGLGLSYSRRIVEAHGGTLSVQNNAGAGCTFTITLINRI